jgi:NADH dehydrogenase FAD-containing subunit
MSISVESENYDVIVLGAGYAGLMAALRLGRRRLGLRVALVNSEETFVERVRLQESMVAPVKPRIASLSAYLARKPIDFIRAHVVALDVERRRVRVEADGSLRDLGFDQIICALGSRVDVQNAPGVEEHCFRLDAGTGPRSAAALRTKLLANAERRFRVLAIGGGPLSVEAAAEVKTAWPQMDVSLVSASRAGAFTSAKVEASLRRDLSKLGVTLIDHERIGEVRETEVVSVNGRRLPYDICIWAAGMRASPIAKEAGLDVDAQDRIRVGPDLRSLSHPFVLAVGDCGHPIAPTGAPYRASALTAAVSGVYAAEQAIANRVGRPLPPFSFSTFAQAIAIGRYAAVFPLDANDHPILFVIGGRIARRLRAVLIWLVLHFVTFERSFPGVQSWPGRKRVSKRQATVAVENPRVVHPKKNQRSG